MHHKLKPKAVEVCMPQFEYTCNDCHYRFDKVVARWDTKVNCPICEGSVKKLMSTFAVGASQNGAAAGVPDIGPKMCSNC